MLYRAVVKPGNESGYVAFIPALKGCVSQGPTKDAAIARLKEAAQDYLDTLIEDGVPVPEEVVIEEIDLKVA
jgi:predicted RNase H-like HicB family nuclease